MQRYYFNFFDGTRWIDDSIGQELEDISKLHIEAKLSLIDLSRGYILANKLCVLLYNITDQNGEKVCTVRLSINQESFSVLEHANDAYRQICSTI